MARDRRGSRSGRKSRSKRAPAEAPEPARVYEHPLYGPIPLLVRTWSAGEQTWVGYELDPDYQAPLPPGAVRGNPRRQLGRGAFDTPRYFHVDQPRSCVQCGEPFVFSAREQQHWYETLGFNFASTAIRCAACRRQRRSDKALHHAVEQAKRELVDKHDDAGAQLALAEAIVELRERSGHGKLDEAVAAARRARRLLSKQSALVQALTHYWEARAHALAERSEQARACFEAFLLHAGPKAHRRQIAEAERWLAGLC